MTNALWTRYRTTGDPAAREELIESHLGLVYHCARAVARRGNADAELEELVSAGTLGLIHAMEQFEPERGLAFSTFAVPRIRGAILDELRARDWAPRAVRSRARQLASAEAVVQQHLGRRALPAEVAHAMGASLDDYWRWRADTTERRFVGLDEPQGDPYSQGARWQEVIPDHQATPLASAERRDAMDVLQRAIVDLPPKERTVLTLYHYEHLNLKQISAILHLTESRVSQIRTRALTRLRSMLAPDEGHGDAAVPAPRGGARVRRSGARAPGRKDREAAQA